jgi:hypothetical protein
MQAHTQTAGDVDELRPRRAQPRAVKAARTDNET